MKKSDSLKEIKELLDTNKLGNSVWEINDVDEELFESASAFANKQMNKQKMNWLNNKATMNSKANIISSVSAQGVQIPSITTPAPKEVYIPKISRENKMFLSAIFGCMGEDESRRLIEKLADLIVKEEFSISKYIDDKLIEFSVTRE